jgi:hypothetical protein
VNQAVEYVFSDGVVLASDSATSTSSCNPVKAKAMFDTLKTTNEFGEVVMDQDGIERFL